MFRTQHNSQIVRSSLALGVISFLISALNQGRDLGFSMPLGNFALFLAALAFGLRGTLYAIIAGVLPTLFLGGDVHGGVRVVTMLCCVGGFRSLEPRLPSYIATLATWVCIIMPARHFYIQAPLNGAPFWEQQVLVTCLTDILLALVAGAFLLNPTVWTLLTGKPYRPNIMHLVIHVLTLTSILSVFGVVATMSRLGIFTENRFANGNMWAAFGLLTMFVAIPSLIGFRLCLLAVRGSQQLLTADGLTPSQLTFGVSSLVLGGDERDTEFVEATKFAGTIDSAQKNEIHSQMMTGVCAVDENGCVLFMNDRFRATANIVLPGTVGRKLALLCEDSPLLKHILELLEATDPLKDLVTELKVSGPNGSNQFFEISLRPHDTPAAEALPRESSSGQLQEEGGGPAGKTPRVVTVRDITEHRTVERHLLESQRLGSMAQFVTGAANTFTDTFTSIVGRASCALLSSDVRVLRTALESVSTSAVVGGKLAGQLLEYGHNRQGGSSTTVDMRESVREVLPLMQNLVGESFTVTLETRAESAFADIDLQLVTQALSNLVTNSRESYDDGRGEIAISVGTEEIDQLVAHLHPGTRPGRFVRLRVSDEGSGMSAEVLAHAVDPLFSTKREGGHTGLGLSTVFAILREHDGFMTIESRPDRGTDVVLYFPVSSGTPQIASEPVVRLEQLPKLPAPVNCSVLVIEGRDELRALLIEMVELLGYQASPCRNQAEALDFVRTHHVDIVVLDETLPRVGGQALMKQLRQERAEIKGVVLATSTHAMVEASDSVVTKPFDITQLGFALRAVDASEVMAEKYD